MAAEIDEKNRVRRHDGARGARFVVLEFPDFFAAVGRDRVKNAALRADVNDAVAADGLAEFGIITLGGRAGLELDLPGGFQKILPHCFFFGRGAVGKTESFIFFGEGGERDQKQ